MNTVFKSGIGLMFGAAFFVLSALPGAAGLQQGEKPEDCTVCGTLYDVRGGELLVDEWQLRLAPGAELIFEDAVCKEADFLKTAKMASVCVHFNKDGLVRTVHAGSRSFLHQAQPQLLDLLCGPSDKIRGGEPIYICVYASGHIPAQIRLFIDGVLIERGQIKTGSFLYFIPSGLAEGSHRIKAAVRAGELYREEEWTLKAVGD
ncbi:hypothetical protein IJT93_08660 [bacterium]|nr:hypothetical protein [bacterium]